LGAVHAEQGEPPSPAPPSPTLESAVDLAEEAGPSLDGRTPIAHAFLRAQGGVHGEVAVYRSGESRVVETLLYSRVLKRVVAEIALREADAWPQAAPGSTDSAAYVAALRRAQKKVWWESARHPAERDRVQEMVISFEVGPAEARVSLFAVNTAAGTESRRRIVERRLLESVPVSLEYARRDQRLIVEDAFGLDSVKAAALVEGAKEP
jgi:hypothetical protein